ncbi:MAG TPA: general secretion pathway protein GspB [Steroidobacteraceae bacterium]|nr:general secretion pathway protein GspB [Steroidobacteraceae bacterium]
MSFILDALKKSESDRQRQSGPSLFEVKVAPPRRRLPIWAVAIALLLAINVVVISWMLLRHPSEPAPAAAAVAGAATAPATETARAAVAAPAPLAAGAMSADRSIPPPGGATATSASAPATAVSPAPSAAATSLASHPDAGRSGQSAADSPEVIAPSDYAPAVEPGGAPRSAAAAGTTDDLPLYQQIVGSAGLPSLHLDLHVFAQHPQDRFVMINMHRLQEGDSLPSGVQVESIRPDGAVLSYHGTRFLLPRN